jgi:hypothetical protein
MGKLSDRVSDLADNVESIRAYLHNQEDDVYVSAKSIARWFECISNDLTCAYNDEDLYHERTIAGHARKPGESVNAAHTLTTAEYQKEQIGLIRFAVPLELRV